jgi:hypothetical protein
MAAAAGATRYLTREQFEPGKYYKIEMPITIRHEDDYGNQLALPNRYVQVRYGKFVENRLGAPVFALNPPHSYPMSIGLPFSTEPITDNLDDTAVRVSLSGKEMVVQKALSGLPEEPAAKVRGFLGGKKRKTRRKGKKTVRRK